MSGVLLTLGGIVTIVLSVVFVSVGGVISLLCALGLAAGCAATGFGSLKIVRASGALTPDARPPTPERAVLQRRMRKNLRIQSVLLIVVGVSSSLVSVLVAVWDSSVIRFGVLGVLLVVFGIGGLLVAARSERPIDELDAEPIDETKPGPGWVLVTRRDPIATLIIAAPGASVAVLALFQIAWIVSSAGRYLSGETFVGGLAFALVLVVLVSVAVTRTVPQVWVDVDAQRVKCGSRVAPWSAVTAARLGGSAVATGGTRSLVLTLEGPEKLRIPLILRRRGELTMTPQQRSAALALVDGAAITVPRAPEDPKGKFSTVLFPSHLRAAQARELVARPPRSDEDLPVPIG